MCVNFTDLNPRLKIKRYPMRDVQSVLQRLHGSRLFTGIDMKAGFHNIQVGDTTTELLGVVTQDGLF